MTPSQSLMSGLVSQLRLRSQFGPPVAWKRATRAALSRLITVSSVLARRLSAVAVILVTPSAAPRTSPPASTVATEARLDDRPNRPMLSTGCPFASRAVAVKRKVSPGSPYHRSVSAAGNPPSATTSCSTSPLRSPPSLLPSR